MKKTCYAVCLILVAVFAAGPFGVCVAQEAKGQAQAPEAEENFIATIDLAAVYSLHPAMQYYDQKVGLFIRPGKQGGGVADFTAAIESRRGEFQRTYDASASEIKRMKGEIDALTQELGKLDTQKAIESAPVSQKFDAEIQAAADDTVRGKLLAQRTEELRKIEVKFAADLKAKKKKIADLLGAYEKIQRSLLKVYYLTPEETAARFDEIKADVKDAVKLAAKKRGAKAVINLNQIARRENRAAAAEGGFDEKIRAARELDELFSGGPDYSKVLALLRSMEPGLTKEDLKTRNPQMSESEYMKMNQQSSRERERENVAKGYSSRESILDLEPLRGAMAAPVVYGGTDITILTVGYILVKNGVNKEKAEIMSEVILESLPYIKK